MTFQLPHHVPFGQEVLITGDSDALGSWSPVKARKLAWQEGDVWRVTVDLPAETAVQYKYVGSLPTLPHTLVLSLPSLTASPLFRRKTIFQQKPAEGRFK